MRALGPLALRPPPPTTSCVDPTELLWLGVNVLRWGVLAFALLFVVATILSETGLPQWPARMWDFPRSQILVFVVLIALVYPILAWHGGMGWFDWTVPALMVAVAARQTMWIWPYVARGKRDLEQSDNPDDGHDDEHTVRLLISNVLQENEEYELWREVVGREEADLVACAETTEKWISEIDKLLAESHPHQVKVPQDNYYGMAVYSRVPLHDVEVEHVVQDDVPSVHVTLELKGGRRVRVHVLHPRPPAPQEGDSSSPRDAELTVMARRIEQATEAGEAEAGPDALPTIVCGDMNDVAWSRTTALFLRISGLLDPRRGRGLFNTFHAGHWWVRFPLDHFFVDRRFRLVEMRRLDYAGSDHFPVYLSLALEPDAESEQPRHEVDAEDREEADEIIETEREREANGDEDGHLSQDHSPEAQPDHGVKASEVTR